MEQIEKEQNQPAQDPKPNANFREFLTRYFKRFESLFEIGTLIAYILVRNHVEGGSLLLGIGFSALATLYFLGAFISHEGIDGLFGPIAVRIYLISSSVAFIGINFMFQNYEGGELQAKLGILTIIPAFILLVFKRISGNKNYTPHLVRAGTILMVCLYLLFYEFETTIL